MAIRQRLDRSVKSIGPDGALRRFRYSQEAAHAFLSRGLVIAKWDRTHTRVRCIQWLPEGNRPPQKPQRWLKTGTRFSYREQIANSSVWQHKALPIRAMDAALGFIEPPEVIDLAVQSLFRSVELSIMRKVPLPSVALQTDALPRRAAAVVAIDSFRRPQTHVDAPRDLPLAA